ncbi:MAG: hypothetical protein P9M05_11595 [Candidatus Stygibacter australis]|nr:hypothetical protein [Candidatus Stygibacter australis]
MGNERIGTLPKSRIWRDIVREISEFAIDNDNIQEITQKTLRNVRKRYEEIALDNGLHSAIKFFVILSVASKQENPAEYLKKENIYLPEIISPIRISKIYSDWVEDTKKASEYFPMKKAAYC